LDKSPFIKGFEKPMIKSSYVLWAKAYNKIFKIPRPKGAGHPVKTGRAVTISNHPAA